MAIEILRCGIVGAGLILAALAGALGSLDGRQDFDVEPVRVMRGQVLVHLGDEVAVVGAVCVEPENRLGAGGAGAAYFFGTPPRAGFEHTALDNLYFVQGKSFHMPFSPKFISVQSSFPPALFGSRRRQLV